MRARMSAPGQPALKWAAQRRIVTDMDHTKGAASEPDDISPGERLANEREAIADRRE